MSKRIKVHKNHIFLTILFNFFILILVGSVAVGFIMITTLKSFTGDCNQNEEVTAKLAKLVEKTIQDNARQISIYGNQIYISGDETEEELKDRLTRYEELGTFDCVYLMSQTGKVITASDDKIAAIDQSKLYRELLNTKYLNKIYHGSDDTIVYAYHIKDNNQNKGWILGTEKAQISSQDLGENLEDKTGEFYILDEKKNVISYSTKNGYDFCYQDIPKENFYSATDSEEEQTRQLLTALGNMDEEALKLNGGKNDAILQLAGLKQLLTTGNMFWYEQDVVVNRAQTFSVLYGRTAQPSAETLTVISVGMRLIAFIFIVFFILIILVIATQASSNVRIAKMAYLDTMTGWTNWNRFRLDGKRLLHRHKNKKYALVSFDIDHFRIISELDGYQRGEEILKQVSKLLSGILRSKEIFARFSIDEFALLLRYANEEELQQRIQMIDTTLRKSITMQSLHFHYGVFYITDYEVDINRMHIYSSMAKDVVKKEHGENIGIFTENLHASIMRDKELESHMEEALNEHEFLVYLQPKYSSDGSHVAGAEALVRWNSKTMGMISPGEFIPLFEKNGFIRSLDEYMIREVCKIQKKWLEQGHHLVTISVNVSRAHLLDPHLVTRVQEMIEEYRIPYSCIELELTESAFFEDKNIILDTVNRLQQLGFKVSMDDFGSGYSSLNSLKDLSLDVIKLDRDFFMNNGNENRGEIVIKDTITLAKHLNMEIVAEGIETKEQVDFLKELGCDMIQGFYFAKPMPVNEFEKLMGYTQ